MDNDQIREAVLLCFEDGQSLTEWWSRVCMKHLETGKLIEWVDPSDFKVAIKMLVARGKVYPQGEEHERIFVEVLGHPQESVDWFRSIGQWISRECSKLSKPEEYVDVDSELEKVSDDDTDASGDGTPLVDPTDVVDTDAQ